MSPHNPHKDLTISRGAVVRIFVQWLQFFRGATDRAKVKSTVAKALAAFTEGFFSVPASIFFLLKSN